MVEESIQKIITENNDVLEIGTPGKEGAIKVHGDFNNLELFKKRIDNALLVRNYANAQIKINFKTE